MSAAYDPREEGEAADRAASPAPEGPTVDLDEDAVDLGEADDLGEAGDLGETGDLGEAGEATDAGGEATEEVPADDRSPEELQAALADTEQRLEQYVDHLKRERAEFENYRKRAARERQEAMERGEEQLVERLLPVLDNFGLALEAANRSEDEGLAKGVQMVHTELVSALTESGLEEVPGEGAAFDPEIHEAMMSEESEEALSEPVVTEVFRPGYRFKGRVLRPASVKVARSETME